MKTTCSKCQGPAHATQVGRTKMVDCPQCGREVLEMSDEEKPSTGISVDDLFTEENGWTQPKKEPLPKGVVKRGHPTKVPTATSEEAEAAEDFAASEDPHDVEQEESEPEPEAEPEPEPKPKNALRTSTKQSDKMPKRKNQQKGSNRMRQAPVEEVPVDTLRDTPLDRVSVTIRRKTSQGKYANIAGLNRVLMPPMKLLELTDPLVAHAGGGVFEVDVGDPETGERVTKFLLNLEGQMRVPDRGLTIAYDDQEDRLKLVPRDNLGSVNYHQGAPVQSALAGGVPGGALPARAAPTNAPAFPQPQFNQQGQLLPPPQDMTDRWMQGYDAPTQWDLLRQKYEREHGHTPPAAQVAMKYSDRLEQRSDGTIKKLEEELGRLRAEVERERQERSRTERELEKTKYEGQLEALKEQIRSLSEHQNKPQEKKWDPDALKAVAGVASSVLPALIKMLQDSSHAQKQQWSEMLKTFASSNKNDDMSKTLGTLASTFAPIVVKMLDNKSPQALAEAESARFDQTATLVSMVQMMLQQQQGEQPEWWVPILQQALESVGSIGQSLQMRTAAEKAQRTQRVLPQGNGQAGEPHSNGAAQPQQDVPTGSMEKLLEHFKQQDEFAALMTAKVLESVPPSMGWHTAEWATIIFNLHCKLDADQMVDLICDHVAHCYNFKMLPTPLVKIYDDPKGVLGRILLELPVAQPELMQDADPEYVRTVVERCAERLAWEARESEKVEEEEELQQSGQEAPSDEQPH